MRFLAGMAILAVLMTGLAQLGLVLAQQSPANRADGARDEFELARMAEIAQEAHDYMDSRKDVLRGLPSDVQGLVADAEQSLEDLRRAIERPNLTRARTAFRQATDLLDEIRFRCNEAMDAGQVATARPEQAADMLEDALTRARARLSDLQRLVAQNPLPAIEAEVARIGGLMQALEQPSPSATPDALREQMLVLRRAIQELEIAIASRLEAAP